MLAELEMEILRRTDEDDVVRIRRQRGTAAHGEFEPLSTTAEKTDGTL